MSSYRFLRAYSVTFSVLVRYAKLWILKNFVGSSYGQTLTTRAHTKTARQIVTQILKLRGLYIKIGQTLSIMTNFLPEAITRELEQLQDALPPHPYSDVEERFLAEFNKTPREIFQTFQETPIASASLGQVHEATLADGSHLAVKLLHPHIEEIVSSDLKTIRNIFSLIDWFFPDYGFRQVYEECSQIILKELDLESEGKNIEKIAANFQGDPASVFPRVYWEYSTKKILTVEFINGIKVTNIAELQKAGLKPREVAVALIHSYCKQIFIDGLYHADPHPGNVIIQARSVDGAIKPAVALIDFGATASISPPMKAGMASFVEGLIKKDTQLLSRAMKQMGFIAREDKEETFDKIVEYFYDKIKGIKIDNFKEINISQFQHLNDIFELRKMDISLRELTTTFHVPKDWILLERTLILMMGLVTHLDPRLNPIDIVIPYVEEFVLGKDKKVSDLILQTSKDLVISYINLPHEIRRLIKKMESGKINFNTKAQREQTHQMAKGFRQIAATLIGIFLGGLAYLMHQQGDMPFFQLFRNLSLSVFALVSWSMIRSSK